MSGGKKKLIWRPVLGFAGGDSCPLLGNSVPSAVCGAVCPLTVVIREIVAQVRVHDFFLQQVDLVEEQDDRGALEPLVGDDGLEQRHALLHPVLQEKGGKEELQSLCIRAQRVSRGGLTRELPLQANPAHCRHEEVEEEVIRFRWQNRD